MNLEPANACGRKLKIILLEDDPLLCHFFEGIIRDWRKDVDLLTFENGDEVLRELSRSQPDLLITDAIHPGMDGGGIVCKLAQKPTHCAVLWTSGGSDFAPTSFFTRLRIEVLPKPFGRDAFREKLNLLLGSENIPVLGVVPFVQNRPNAGDGQGSPARQ